MTDICSHPCKKDEQPQLLWILDASIQTLRTDDHAHTYAVNKGQTTVYPRIKTVVGE